MPTKTIHIVPMGGGWALKKEGDDAFVLKRDAKNEDTLYSTQKQAIEAAREIGQRSSAGQIVVHSRDGSIRWRDVRGLPEIQTPPRKSDLGTKAIERAVAAVIRERL
jgi:hypothetical protein